MVSSRPNPNLTRCSYPAYLSSAHSDGGSPDSLHGQGDEAGDGVSQGQMKHQKVDVGATSKNLKMFQRKLEEGFSNIENAYSESVVIVNRIQNLEMYSSYCQCMSMYASCLDFFREHSRVYYLSQCHFD